MRKAPIAFGPALALTLLASTMLAQTPAPKPARTTSSAAATESSTGFSNERLARIDTMMQSYVDQGLIPGAVALVLREGRPVYQKAVGWADKESGRPMRMDTMFRIASQTKAVTSVAVLTLVEEGKLGL